MRFLEKSKNFLEAFLTSLAQNLRSEIIHNSFNNHLYFFRELLEIAIKLMATSHKLITGPLIKNTLPQFDKHGLSSDCLEYNVILLYFFLFFAHTKLCNYFNTDIFAKLDFRQPYKKFTYNIIVGGNTKCECRPIESRYQSGYHDILILIHRCMYVCTCVFCGCLILYFHSRFVWHFVEIKYYFERKDIDV